MFINLGVTLLLTPLTPAPSEKIKQMVDSVREPEYAGPAVDIDSAPEH